MKKRSSAELRIVWGLALLVSLLGLMGCGGGDDDSPSTTTTVVTNTVNGVTQTNVVVVTNAPAADVPAAASTMDFKGTWKGVYESEGGSSQMRLDVLSGPDAAETYAGQFSFSAGRAGSLFCVQQGNSVSMRLSSGDWWMGVAGSVNNAGTEYRGEWIDGKNNKGTMTLNR